mgnify:CR=1 FL=1
MCYKDIVCKQKPSDKGCTYRNKIIYDLKSYHYEDIGQSEGIQSEKETDEARKTELRHEANQKAADMLKKETSKTLHLVLDELSFTMKNKFARSDA